MKGRLLVAPDLVGRPATDLAALVRAGEASPLEVLEAHLEQIDRLDRDIGAFEHLRAEKALAEAKTLGDRDDLADLPLAGVPIPVKDNIPVAGESLRIGSYATPARPMHADHEIVERLTDAGAIVVGISRMPELGLWGTSDSATGVTHNPWDRQRTAGGSSGGSAAAVASAMAPAAHGNDGLGSIRIPAACCGLFGMKPGSGVVPAHYSRGSYDWFDLVENGPLTTTVADAARLLAIMAGRADLGVVDPQDEPLRIAVSTAVPLPGLSVDRERRDAALRTARLLADAGHSVTEADPPAPVGDALGVTARWFVAGADEAEGLDRAKLQRRTRVHTAVGRTLDRVGAVRASQKEHFRKVTDRFFADYDVLVSPTLARDPIPADMRRRSWLANVVSNLRYAPTAASWNMTGYPAAAVPAGSGSNGLPLSIQLVAPHGGDALVLRVAALLEQLAPWPRHAPIAT